MPFLKTEWVPSLLFSGGWQHCYLKHFDVWVFTLEVQGEMWGLLQGVILSSMCQECQTPLGKENARQGHRLYLQPILMKSTKGSAQNQKQVQLLQAMFWQNISTSLRISITELLSLRWAVVNSLLQITMLPPTLESPVFVTEVTG